jgi:hypothetical protein
MSDFYENENDEVQVEQVDKPAPKRKKYESIVDQTKRREQSKLNLAKGRATRAANLKKKKEEEAQSQSYNIAGSDDDYSSSSEEMKLVKKPSKMKRVETKDKPDNQFSQRLDKMEELILQQLKQSKKKTSRPIRQTIVQIPTQQYGGGQSNPQLQNTKRYLLDI